MVYSRIFFNNYYLLLKKHNIENLLSEHVLDAAIEVHRTLGGPGPLESLYEDALFHELRLRNIPALSQVPTGHRKLKQIF